MVVSGVTYVPAVACSPLLDSQMQIKKSAIQYTGNCGTLCTVKTLENGDGTSDAPRPRWPRTHFFPTSASATGPVHTAKVYVSEQPAAQSFLCAIYLSFYCLISTKTIPRRRNSQYFSLPELPKHRKC